MEHRGTSYQREIADGDLADEETWCRYAGDPQESHLRVAKLFRTENGRIDVIFSGATDQYYNSGQRYAAGVGLILFDRARRTLIGYGTVSDRVLSTQLHLKNQKFTIIYVYIPQSMLLLEVQKET